MMEHYTPIVRFAAGRSPKFFEKFLHVPQRIIEGSNRGFEEAKRKRKAGFSPRVVERRGGRFGKPPFILLPLVVSKTLFSIPVR
jgi:hypothetical protein